MTGFIESILANPDDDTVRLIYADWLQENGHRARAELIRVQCLEPTDKKAAMSLLRDQELDLWKAFASWCPKDWTMTLHAHEPRMRVGIKEGVQDIWLHLSRGFVDEVLCRLSDWIGISDRHERRIDYDRTQHVEEWGREILACQPVRIVKLSNFRAVVRMNLKWTWHPILHGLGGVSGEYESKVEARLAMSRSLIKWSRRTNHARDSIGSPNAGGRA